MKSFQQYLQEKLIVINKGAKEGQVVFLAGGAGSGKGFARTHFLEDNKFKTFDVDEFKRMYLKMKTYPELAHMDLRNPKDVFALHTFVKQKGVKNTALTNMLRAAQGGVTQPNILFDVTMKDMEDVTDVAPALLAAGYKKENIHIVWVLANYSVAVERNRKRSRVVPEDVLLKTHEGAANVMNNMVFKGMYPYSSVNGSVYVILNNQENTVLYNDPKEASKTGNFVIKDFTYLKIKDEGKKIQKDAWQKQLYQWILHNIPKSRGTKDIWKPFTG